MSRIDYLPGARDFLESALQHEVRLLLVTNSHLDTLAIKTEVTGITEFFDAIYTSHELGHAKEDQPNPSVLESARTFGISMLLNVTRPDTRRPARENRDFPTIESVASLISR